MVEIRVIFGDDDRENEEFLGFDLHNIEEAEERYIRQLDGLNDFDSNIEFSEMGSSIGWVPIFVWCCLNVLPCVLVC
jgi:hypothetical protein